jgi:IcmF-related N-terminal domain
MNELLDLLRRLPRPLKYLGLVFLLMPLVYVLSRLLGVEKYWWVFALGILLIAILLSLLNVAVSSREKRQARAFEGELRRDAQRPGASREEVKQALGDLAAKWTEAVTQLKQAGLDVYALPWYLLIGEPQSGKSTTLKNSGLEFPVGADALSGAGGTRNCDWWFANEAVILDTAGRFTFQEESAPDQAEWSSFLKLLRKYRRYCPINGVLVVIPCTSLLEDSAEEQERKATNIRQKLLHVQRVLEIRFPVFILVTKADRVLGFSEFFLKLDPIDQQQLFGWSTPDGPNKPYDPESFDGVYEQIANRLYRLRLKFLGDEENPAQADKLYVFPEEFRALKTPLANYFKTIFLRTRFDEPFAFRGFYFSSGVQQGRPIAQASRDLLDVSGGAGEGVLENLESLFKKARAFFIRHFYEKKVFPEQGLISRTAAAEARQRKTLWLVRGLGIFVILLFLGGMYPAWRSLQNVLNPIRHSVAQAKACVEKNCSIADSYQLATDLEQERENALKHRFWFLLFLKGTQSNELLDKLGAVQRKVYLGGVVQPLLADTEARMASLDWASFTPQYKVFRPALDAMLAWRAAKTHADADGAPLVKPEELKLLEIIDFERKARGVKATDRSAEIDAWIAGLQPSDDHPNRNLEGALRSGTEIDVAVPDPAQPLAKYEEFWTVRNLARWDWTLIEGLKQYAVLYGEMVQTPHADPAGHLVAIVGKGKQFRTNYETISRHMQTPRPGESGFPGATPAEWKAFFRKDYGDLMRWKPVASAKIGQNRRDEILQSFDADYSQLEAQRSEYSYLLLDPTQPKKPAWSKPAETLGGVLNGLTGYSDIEAFHASEDGKPLSTLAASTDATENAKKIDEWRKKQEAAQADILTKADALSTGSPEQFKWTERRPFVVQTAQLALLARTLPPAGAYFKEVLVDNCQGESCYQPAFALPMIGSASGMVAMASRQQAAKAFDEASLSDAMKGVWGPESTYLRSYIDRMAGRGGGGGAGFIFPAAAASATSWPAFQTAIRGWSPQGGGGGAVAPDASGQLSPAQFAQIDASNAFLHPIYEEYRSRIERPRAAAAGVTIAPELLEAANAFRGAVTALSDQPLPAWRQLARAEGGTSLKQYQVFSANPRLKTNPEAQRMDRQVADFGAHLMRDAIRPIYAQKEPVVWSRLQACCLGKFPLINDLELQNDRQKFGNGTAYTRSGSPGTGQASYRVDLPTIALADISGVILELGGLAYEFALDPIFAGEAPEFDFVGENRPILSAAGLWERFIYGPPAAGGQGQPREHHIELRLLDRPTGSGTVFMGDRVSQVTLFDRGTIFRPSTDAKSGHTPPPYVWRLGSADSPLSIIGRNEDAKGWTGVVEISGGPLKLFYYILAASEERTPSQDRHLWNVRVEIPDAEHPNGRLQGVFELKIDEPLPGVIIPR